MDAIDCLVGDLGQSMSLRSTDGSNSALLSIELLDLLEAWRSRSFTRGISLEASSVQSQSADT
jgi:hypothetical protein